MIWIRLAKHPKEISEDGSNFEVIYESVHEVAEGISQRIKSVSNAIVSNRYQINKAKDHPNGDILGAYSITKLGSIQRLSSRISSISSSTARSAGTDFLITC